MSRGDARPELAGPLLLGIRAGPIKIAHLTVVHPRDDIRIFQKQCRSLQRSGFAEVVLFVADGLGDNRVDEVRIHDVFRPGRGRLARAVLGSFAMWRALRRECPDIAHVHDPELLFVATMWRVAGRTVVYDMHETLPREILTKEWIPAPMRRVASILIDAVQRIFLRGMPTVFAETSYRRDFASIRQSVTVQNFPMLDELAQLEARQLPHFTAGYCGGVSRERGMDKMLEAIARARLAGRDVRALFVGPVSHEVHLDPAQQRATANGWLELPGRVPPRASWQLMASCHVGLAVLMPSPNFVDSYPTKLFEYMALGLPVIISDFPLWRSVIDAARCGFTVDPTDPASIEDAIIWIQDHPEDAREMGARGKASVFRSYSWASEFAKLCSFYDRVARPVVRTAVSG